MSDTQTSYTHTRGVTVSVAVEWERVAGKCQDSEPADYMVVWLGGNKTSILGTVYEHDGLYRFGVYSGVELGCAGTSPTRAAARELVHDIALAMVEMEAFNG